MNIENIKIDKKKYLNIAIIFACIIAITLVGTYALKIWTSTENTELTFRIGDYFVGGLTCKSGEDVTISNIGPIFDYTKDGEVVSFTVLSSSTNTKPLNVSFNISTISDNLKEESFKYTLMSSIDNTTFTEVLSGNFKDSTNNSTIELITGNVITRKTYFKLIIYIDGNMENPISMQGGSLTGNIEMCIEAGDITIDSFKVNGTETTTFPLSSGYDINTTCSDASIAFDYRSQSYEISNITKSGAKCGFTYTTKSNPTYLNNYIKSLAGTTQGTGQLVHEATGYSGTENIKSFDDYSQYKTNSSKTEESGSNINNYVIDNITDPSVATVTYSDSQSLSRSSLGNYKIFSYNVSGDGEYTMKLDIKNYTPIGSTNSSASYQEAIEVYVNNIRKGQLYINKTLSSNYRLGKISSGDNIKVVYFVEKKPDAVINPTPGGGTEAVSYKENLDENYNLEQNHNNIKLMALAGPSGISNSFSFSFSRTGDFYNDYGYRYEGKNPNNYIYFNNELWRIIGVFDENSHGKSGEYLTKIIKNDSLGSYVWDKSYYNNWRTASLRILLNLYYYNATDGTYGGDCYLSTYLSTNITSNCDYTETGLQSEYRNMVEGVTWYLGGKNSTDYTAEAFYIGERDSTSVYSGNASSIIGYIGLMYASDFGYSVLSSSCARTTNLKNYSTSDCGGSSWLVKEPYEWTITPRSDYASSSFFLTLSAHLDLERTTSGMATYPVLYLKSNVQKISGTGTITDPYRLGY